MGLIISDCSATVDVIYNLTDAPVLDGSMTKEQFKDAFDQAGRGIKTYINNTLIPQIEAYFQTKLGSGDITGTMLADGTISSSKIALLAITTALLDNGAVTTGKLDSGAVTTGKIDGGAVTYAKLNADAKSTAYTGTADVADWDEDDLEATVTITGLAVGDNIIVAPAPSSFADWRDCGVYCSAQGADSITLKCDTIPENDIDVQVLVVR